MSLSIHPIPWHAMPDHARRRPWNHSLARLAIWSLLIRRVPVLRCPNSPAFLTQCLSQQGERQGRTLGVRGPWPIATGKCLLRLVSMGCGLWIEFVVFCGKSFLTCSRQHATVHSGGNRTQSCQLKRNGESLLGTFRARRGRAAERLQLPA